MNDKQRVAEYAAQQVNNGMLVGLGTGSTANLFIDALARRQTQEGLTIRCVASSVVSNIYARQAGLALVGFDQVEQLDLYVDGADEVSPDLTLLKGRGSDLVREKLLANASEQFWVLIDASKKVDFIGQKYPIPVEVMPFAWQMVRNTVSRIGGEAELRRSGDGLHVTSHGSLVLDCRFAAPVDALQLDQQLNAIPGLVEHGIFSRLASRVLCGEGGQVSVAST